MKIRRDKIDIEFSKYIRLRENYTCQACGKSDGLMDCAHIFSRRHAATRWDVNNAICLCRGCHMYYTDHPFEWVRWCHGKFGYDAINDLELKSRTICKRTKKDKDLIYTALREKVKQLEESYTEIG